MGQGLIVVVLILMMLWFLSMIFLTYRLLYAVLCSLVLCLSCYYIGTVTGNIVLNLDECGRTFDSGIWSGCLVEK